mmetsp:Transcript_40510/g.114742  ORF Transcript_40510/g.114742 Transcript_40510/m.114742 type:complete len:281 (-) Transcript_40510:273-1115(-)
MKTTGYPSSPQPQIKPRTRTTLLPAPPRRVMPPTAPSAVWAAVCCLAVSSSLLGSCTACSILAPAENCAYNTPQSQWACEAAVVLRGKVLPRPHSDKADQPSTSTLQPFDLISGSGTSFSINVRVTELIKGENSGAPSPPFEVVISGFQPCCLCGTEAPAVGEERLFFVRPVAAASDKLSSGLSAYELSDGALGRGVADVTEESIESVLQGIDAEHSGSSCESLYCEANPLCLDQTHDCPAMLETDVKSKVVQKIKNLARYLDATKQKLLSIIAAQKPER